MHIALADEKAFVALLDADPDVLNSLNPIWGSPIIEHVPLEWRHHLLSRGLQVDDVFTAVLLNDLDRARELIDAEPDLIRTARKRSNGSSLLHWSLWRQRDAFACWVIEQGADIHLEDDNSLTPILMACGWGCEQAVDKLLAAGADSNYWRGKLSLVGWTVRGPVPTTGVLRLLLDRGLDPNKDRIDKGTSLDLAIAKGLTEVAAVLRANGAQQRKDLKGGAG